jgi:hypothetical protein
MSRPPAQPQTTKDWLTVSEFAIKYGMSPWSVRCFASHGKIQKKKIGGNAYYYDPHWDFTPTRERIAAGDICLLRGVEVCDIVKITSRGQRRYPINAVRQLIARKEQKLYRKPKKSSVRPAIVIYARRVLGLPEVEKKRGKRTRQQAVTPPPTSELPASSSRPDTDG